MNKSTAYSQRSTEANWQLSRERLYDESFEIDAGYCLDAVDFVNDGPHQIPTRDFTVGADSMSINLSKSNAYQINWCGHTFGYVLTALQAEYMCANLKERHPGSFVSFDDVEVDGLTLHALKCGSDLITGRVYDLNNPLKGQWTLSEDLLHPESLAPILKRGDKINPALASWISTNYGADYCIVYR